LAISISNGKYLHDLRNDSGEPMTDEEYLEIKNDIERVIMAVSTASHIKKARHTYMMTNTEQEEYLRAWQILAAEIRQGVEKAFDKYIDREHRKQVEEESSKRKRGPRQKPPEIKKTEPKSESKIGGFKVKSF
jgi:hypothetical protein